MSRPLRRRGTPPGGIPYDCRPGPEKPSGAVATEEGTMRVQSFMRDIRAGLGLSLSQVEGVTGITKGEISRFERGHTIPTDRQAARLGRIYGSPLDWYPRGVLRVLIPDAPLCPGCGYELGPHAPRRRMYHGEACRSRARRALEVQAAYPPTAARTLQRSEPPRGPAEGAGANQPGLSERSVPR